MTLEEYQADRRAAHARTARPGTCRRCGQPVLRGLDADTAAFTVIVDTQPVTPADELRAARESHDLIGRGQSAALWRRTFRHQITPPRYPIHLAHKCENNSEGTMW